MAKAKSISLTKKNLNYPKTLVIPITMEMWSALRKTSFDHHTSMAEITRTALQKVINKYQSDVDNKE